MAGLDFTTLTDILVQLDVGVNIKLSHQVFELNLLIGQVFLTDKTLNVGNNVKYPVSMSNTIIIKAVSRPQLYMSCLVLAKYLLAMLFVYFGLSART